MNSEKRESLVLWSLLLERENDDLSRVKRREPSRTRARDREQEGCEKLTLPYLSSAQARGENFVLIQVEESLNLCLSLRSIRRGS